MSLILQKRFFNHQRCNGIHKRTIRSSYELEGCGILCKRWKGPFALKGVMSVEDAKRAIDIGASAIMLSNHGGRQLDGSRSPFDQLKTIVDAVGGKIEIIVDGGIRRGTHVLKALSLGATACGFGKGFLFCIKRRRTKRGRNDTSKNERRIKKRYDTFG